MEHDAALHAAGQAAAFWTALLLLLLLVLSLLVVRQRQTHKVTFGDEGVPQLGAAIRALIAMAVVSAPPVAVHMAGGLLLAGRIAHAVALSRSTGTSLPRSVGMLLTWVAYIFCVVALVAFALT